MALTGHRAATGHAHDVWRLPGERRPHNPFLRVFDDVAPRNGWLNSNGKAPCVLIVDDDPAMRMLFSINLQCEGLVVLEAADGGRGLEQARSERPDLVVTDVMMPGLDGFQLAEALRCDERTRRIPLIFISAEAGSANSDRAHELGALAYVTKPFDAPALSSLVASALACAGPREQATALLRASACSESPAYLN